MPSTQRSSEPSHLSARVGKLETQMKYVVEGMDKISEGLDTLSKQYSSSKAFNLTHLGVIVAILLGTGGVGVAFVNGQITSTISSRVLPLEKSSETAHEDRRNMNYRLDQLANVQADSAKIDSSVSEQLKEIETQFKGIMDSENFRYTEQMRYIALMWKKNFAEDFPMELYMTQPKTMRYSQ